ncbi:hypothetical protein OUZ56_003439 [Daphnia magna]|uniref:Uncharacterized protein n=1 Tax=Daphnia magna TaxID=35525 RepID=A0ABR0A8Z7_9CRUS|nr:hypothetical protein OUZ56_003439 [Daphnia magna]
MKRLKKYGLFRWNLLVKLFWMVTVGVLVVCAFVASYLMAASGFSVPLGSDSWKNLLGRQIDAALSSKMLNIEELQKTVADLDVEFDVWKVLLPSFTGSVVVFAVLLAVHFYNKVQLKLMELKVRIRSLERKGGQGGSASVE